MNENTKVVLAKRPTDYPQYDDFKVLSSTIPKLEKGQFLAKNLYLSLDAGFRNWMNESSGDEVLPAMLLNQAVMGLTLSRVIESQHSDYAVGNMLMARFSWEQYTVSNGEDFIVKLDRQLDFPYSYYMGVLGDTGMSAYFSLMDIGKPKSGETVLVSAAGGAVGSIAGQIAKIMGARTVGISSSPEKCQRLIDELGYDAAVNRKSPEGIDAAIAAACPNGVDVYLDSVGGETLQAAIANLNLYGRIALIGSITHYNASDDKPPVGPNNLFELVAKEALMQGLMTHTQADRYQQVREQLQDWLSQDKLKSIEYVLEGIENAGVAFCNMYAGKNFGKTVVKISD
ncbi:MAG: NADPH-dependent curcumin reductase CurA [Arenicella sp.]